MSEKKTTNPASHNENNSGWARLDKRLVALAILVLLAIVYTLSSLSSYIAPPWPLSVTVEDSSSETHCDHGGAITDQSYSRLLFLNTNGEVVNEKQSDRLSSPTTFYYTAVSDDTGIYVLECTFIDDTDYIGTESLVKYDFEGRRIGTLCKTSHNLTDDRAVMPTISNLSIYDGSCYVTFIDRAADEIRVEKLSATPSSDSGETVLCLNGRLPDQSGASYASYSPDDQMLLVQSNLGGIFLNREGAQGFESVEAQTDVSDFANQINTISAIGNGSSVENGTIALAPSFAVRSLLFWLCVAFLAIVLVAVFVRMTVGCIRTKNFEPLQIGGCCVLVIVAVVGLVSYYSYSMLNSKNNDCTKSLLSAVGVVSTCYDDKLASASEEFTANGTLSASTYNALVETLESCQAAQAKANKGIEYYYVTSDAHGNCCYLADSCNAFVSGSQATYFENDAGGLMSFEEVLDNTQFDTAGYFHGVYAAFARVDDGGNTVGLLYATTFEVSHNAFVMSDITKLSVALLDIFVAISFLILEGRNWASCFSLRRRFKREGHSRPEITLGRPLQYLVMGALAVDGALLPLITQDMLAGTAFAGNGLIIAIPPLAYTLGLLVGVPLQIWLSKHLTVRRYLLISSTLATVLFVACAFSVVIGNVLLLTLFIFLSHACIEVVASYVLTLPLYAEDQAQRSKMNRSYASAGVSATALSTLIAGQAADRLGNPFVFVVGAVFAALVIVFIAVFIRGGATVAAPKTEKPNNGAKATHAWNVLRDPHILVLLLCMIMCGSMATGYKSYIFPLLAADEGLSKAVIASISVYCNALVYYINPVISRAEVKVGARITLIISAASLAIGLILFLVNGSLSWAIAMLVLAFVAGKSIDPAFSTYWQSRIVETGVPKDVAYGTIMLSFNGLCLLRNPILGVVLSVVGLGLISPVIGIYCAFNVVVFTAVTKKGGKQKAPAAEDHAAT